MSPEDLIGPYKKEKFPRLRIASADVGQIGLRRHNICGMIEIDVTNAWKFVKENKSISFTVFLIKQISEVLEQFPEITGYRSGKRSRLVFEDIDIAILVEREHQDDKVPVAYVIRRTNKKTMDEIGEEVRKARTGDIGNQGLKMHRSNLSNLSGLYFFLPGFIRRLFWKLLLGSPRTAKKIMGNVVVTSVGMFGNIPGWFLPVSVMPVTFGVGAVVRKPAVVDEKIIPRDILHLSILMNHDVVDGVQMAKFLAKLVENIEGFDS